MAYSVEMIADFKNKCGEGPTWDSANNRVLWTDNATDTVYQYSLKTGKASVMNKGIMVGGIAVNRPGGFVFVGPDGVTVWRGPGDFETVVSEYEGRRLQFNDMTADPQGRIYAGTLYWGNDGMEQTGHLYLISPDGAIQVVDDGMHISNGLSFCPHDKTLYYADSGTWKIYAYEVDPASGALKNRRVLVTVPREDGIPDGLTVDAQGFIWVAMWYGAQIIRYDPEGRVERRVPMPVKQVSSVTFGGEDLTDLYVTSAGSSWNGPLAPEGYDFDAPNIGGPLFRVHTDIQGKHDHMACFT